MQELTKSSLHSISSFLQESLQEQNLPEAINLQIF